MRYIKIEVGNGYCGCDNTEYVEFENDITDAEIDAYAIELARDNAESFEHVATGWDEDFETENDREFYYEGAWFEWEEISEEEYNEEA